MTAAVPEGMNPNARETWPSEELIKSWLGNELDFEMRLGEHTPIPDDPEAAANARRFRDVLGLFCSGVTVVTSVSDGEPVGMTCQSFSSVSLEPPLVMFSPAKTSRAWPLMQRAGFFCVNILAADQSDLSNGMATKGDEKFKGVGWTKATTGAPVIEGVLGYIDCTVHQVIEAGDHYVVIGRVQELSFGDRGEAERAKTDPLLFFGGTYTQPQK
ncbi:MAG TPA: flavin reductase family protein [Marmoricola sp.]|jgi:3-hydroxy-9,10-secoandrosta-1,3,5(10)-triene-9,17-dione monooxygenase reductase component|nr:flavin reductase family protein [Marmoricola sp.]